MKILACFPRPQQPFYNTSCQISARGCPRLSNAKFYRNWQLTELETGPWSRIGIVKFQKEAEQGLNRQRNI